MAIWTLDFPAEAGKVQAFVGLSAEGFPSCHFLLYIIEGSLIDDGFVCVLHIILWKFAVVLPALSIDRIGDVLLLQKQVARVGDICQDYFEG